MFGTEVQYRPESPIVVDWWTVDWLDGLPSSGSVVVVVVVVVGSRIGGAGQLAKGLSQHRPDAWGSSKRRAMCWTCWLTKEEHHDGTATATYSYLTSIRRRQFWVVTGRCYASAPSRIPSRI